MPFGGDDLRKTIGLALRPSALNDEVSPFGVAELAQLLAKCVKEVLAGAPRERDTDYTRGSSCLLRLSADGRGEEAASERADE